MGRRALPLIAALLAAACGGAVGQPAPAPATTPGAPANVPSGYLTDATAPDAAVILPPAPEAGDLRDTADRAIYTATRSMAGTPRWAMAIDDNDLRLPGMYRHFACSLGTTLTLESAPRLTRLMANVARDTGRVSNHAKQVFLRRRPYQLWGGDICVPRTSSLDGSADYPSGHATYGWTMGLILAEIAPPDRSTLILARARAFGESRAVCGMHSASAVEAGRTTAASLIAAEHASAAFRADLAAARTELLALLRRPHPRDEGECQSELNLVAQPAFRGAAAP